MIVQTAGAVVLVAVLVAGAYAALVRCGVVIPRGRMRPRLLHVVESLQITPAASLHVLMIDGRSMLVGASTSGSLVLHELTADVQPQWDVQTEWNVQSDVDMPPKPHRVRVLIVDDAAVMRMVAATILRTHGLTVVGEAASLDDAIADSGTSSPDVVLIDVALVAAPEKAAYDQLAAAYPHAPIVVSGYLSQRALVEAALALGARAYVAKPFVPQRLTETLRNSAANPEDVREAAPNTGV